MHTRTIHTLTPEGDLAAVLCAVQTAYPQIELGCYPHMRGGKFSTSLVMRGMEASEVEETVSQIQERLRPLGVTFTEAEL